MPPGEGEGRAEGLIEQALQAAPIGVPPSESSELLTFLFADIRGYTNFTQRRGDEAAAKLTAKFASIVRELVAEYDGVVFELRGDEAMCVFPSPRQSLRLAVALQERFVEETAADPGLPMTVGIGVDAGEAVRSADGYRGGALNLAARLCSKAGAGDVLASNEVTHLARPIDGIRYLIQDSVELKGIADPVRPMRVLPENADPAEQIARLMAASSPAAAPLGAASWLPGRLGRLPARRLGVLVVVVLLAIAGTVVGITANGGGGTTALAENSVGIFNSGSGHLTSQLAVQNDPTAATSGFGAVWVANTNSGSVSQIDTETRQITTIDVGQQPSAITTGFNSVWVAASGDSRVARIDPSNTSNPRYIDVGADPGGIAAGDGSVWVTNTSDGTLDRIDPGKNKVVETIDVGDDPTGVVVSPGAVWVADSGSNTVSKIVKAGTRYASVADIPVGSDPEGLAVLAGSLWVTNNLSGTVSRIPLGGASVVGGTLTLGGGPSQLAVVGNRLWVANQDGQQIQELDPSDAPRLLRSVSVGVIPGGLTADGDHLWVAGTVDPAIHLGGALNMVGLALGSVDPIGGGLQAAFSLEAAVYDGLVTYRHVTGADSEAVVPDLATAIPAPTNNGLTYTFQLRSGIKFSDGRAVTVFDIRRGLERTLAAGISVLSEVIRGAQNCTPRSCDVSGITVDAASRTVTISLRHPFAGFLANLANQIYAVPSSTPLAVQRRPILGTGPYRFARYNDDRIVVLTRNPYFHVWSSAAQPAGYPDRIVYRVDNRPGSIGQKERREVSDVAAGRADWAEARGSEPLGQLQASFGDRLVTAPGLSVHGLFLNTRVPPFNNPVARRAVAYAVDRAAIAADYPVPATVACQLLPLGYPGYRPYCPFTVSSTTAATWSGPAINQAQNLVARSGTTNTRVTVWAPLIQVKTMADVVKAMNAIGYRAHLKPISDPNAYFSRVADSRSRAQAGYVSYGGLTVDPSGLFVGIFRCHDFLEANPNNLNFPEYCNPSLDRLVNRGVGLTSTSSTTADRVWAVADRMLTYDAPYIPLVNAPDVNVISSRTHNFENNPVIGPLIDQMWVR